MTWITINNVQRVVTPKADNSELLLLYFANCVMVIYICIMFQKYLEKCSGYRVDAYITEITTSKFKGP